MITQDVSCGYAVIEMFSAWDGGLKNTELVDLLYENLSDSIPVPIEWAALYGDEWTAQ